MRRLAYSSAATEDLLEIWWYWADRDESERAAIYLGKLENTVRRSLSRLRNSGRRRPEFGDGVRSLAIVPYVVFYRVGLEHIEIVRVIHARRDMKEPLMSLFAEVSLAG